MIAITEQWTSALKPVSLGIGELRRMSSSTCAVRGMAVLWTGFAQARRAAELVEQVFVMRAPRAAAPGIGLDMGHECGAARLDLPWTTEGQDGLQCHDRDH
ncbi:hypothetical protein [Polyangium sp. 15x6]|uniref:hypothetical protein n=1 Tax=Polyangium sp. 15x6 TaxID=3042687 RepID=UPI00249A3453|nr:hypothetical protein [Polyangium sp. 15x6]MDI3288979.1 hypothetical protein [Polyangium sp. 15x6]